MTPRRVVPIALIGLGAAFLSAAFAQHPIGQRAEAVSYDWRVKFTANPAAARKDIVIVEIDEQTVRALEPIFGRWPWPRLAHSGVISFLTRAAARVIVYDVLFTERHASGEFKIGDQTFTGESSDQMFVDAVRRAGNVVLAANAVEADPERPDDIVTVTLPFDALRSVAAAVGHNVVPQQFGVVRTMSPFVRSRDGDLPYLAVAAALLAENKPVPKTGSTEKRLLKYRGEFAPKQGPPAFATYQFFNLLLAEQKILDGEAPALDPAVFRDKIVFIGTNAAGLFDTHSTPFDDATPGVFVQATAADNELSGEHMTRAPFGYDLALIAAAGVLAAFAASALAVWGTALTLVGLGGGILAIGTWLVARGVWIATVAPLLALLLSAGGTYAWKYIIEDKEKRRVKRLFGRYVSKDVFAQLMENPSLALLGGERREMTVLFSDIRGFTTASERSTPEAVVAQLNEYFGEMVEVLFRHQGTLDKFVGDMVMGLFGAPVADPLHADHAVAAAKDMVASLATLNARWEKESRPQLDIGIGISSGVMIAGNIGSNTIMSYTVIGDPVNLGARLESLNKEYHTHILISDATQARLTQPFETRKIDDVIVKGKTKPVGVYEVL